MIRGSGVLSRAARRLGLGMVAAATLASPAAAQRVSTLNLTCGQAAGLVRQQGAVVLGTGGATFDRFVVSRRFCEVTEIVRPAFVPTRDAPSCPIGYRCKEPSGDEFLGWD